MPPTPWQPASGPWHRSTPCPSTLPASLTLPGPGAGPRPTAAARAASPRQISSHFFVFVCCASFPLRRYADQPLGTAPVMPLDPAKRQAGVFCSLLASVLFACAYYSATLLAELGGEKIYGWRVLVTAPFLGMFVVLSGRGGDITRLWRRVRRQPALWFALFLSSGLLGVQLWLFMWAPVNGYGLDVSLGYFLLPLALVLTGRWCFHERITRLQILACVIAGVGVANELLFAPRVSWPTFVIVLGYPCYFALRRILRTNHLGGMWFDLVLSLPVALWFALEPMQAATDGKPFLLLALLVLGLGLVSAAALILMILASDRLELGLFGLLGYVEPALLVVVALLLGERIAPSQWITYLGIWLAVLLLAGEGLARLRAARR